MRPSRFDSQSGLVETQHALRGQRNESYDVVRCIFGRCDPSSGLAKGTSSCSASSFISDSQRRRRQRNWTCHVRPMAARVAPFSRTGSVQRSFLMPQVCVAGLALLRRGNCSSHDSADVDGNDIRARFIPPHSSNPVQALDLSVFGRRTRMISRVNTLDCDVVHRL
jgi:hypothetical protein